MNTTTNEGFATARVYPGDLNALVKNLMRATGIKDANEVVRAINNGEYQLISIAKAVNATLIERFSTKKRVWVSDSFLIRVLPFHKDSDTADIGNCDSVDLPRSMNNTEIIDEHLGGMKAAKKNAFTLNQVWTYIATQLSGDGKLLTNGYANIFYCLGKDGHLFAVSIYWGGDGWVVDDWRLSERDDWSAGRRVFRNKH